jgi:hypothetical protein
VALPVGVVLKALYCVIYGLIEKPSHEPLEFSVSMQVYGRINHAGKVNVLEEMMFDQAQRVNDFVERNPLSKPLLPQVSVSGLNGRFGLVAKPSSEVAINIINPMMQLFTSKVVVVCCAIVTQQIIDETASQLLGVVLNYLYQASGEHSAPPPVGLPRNLELSSGISA